MPVWSWMGLVVLFFMTMILFDMIADVYSNVAGLVSVSVLWLFVYLLLGSGKAGLDRIVSILKRTSTRTRTCEVLDKSDEHDQDSMMSSNS
jgi:hypothetical protein